MNKHQRIDLLYRVAIGLMWAVATVLAIFLAGIVLGVLGVYLG